jgi:hypothetical protein
MSKPLWSTHKYTRFEVFTAVRIQVDVSWLVTPCSDVVGYQLGGPCWLRVKMQAAGSAETLVLCRYSKRHRLESTHK